MAELKNNYTRISNKILENIVKAKLNGTQYDITLTVWRYTYGFQRCSHEISLTFLADATGKPKRLLQKEVAKLIEKKVLLVEGESTATKPKRIKFNKYFESWEVTKKSTGDQLVNSRPDSQQRGDQLVNSTGDQLVNQERKIKENYKEIYDYYLSLGIVKHHAFTEGMKRAINKAMKENGYTVEDCKKVLDRHKEVIAKTKKSEYPVKPRGLDVFFGQKAANATHLICSEYEEGGKYYEKYIKGKEKKEPVKLELVIRENY